MTPAPLRHRPYRYLLLAQATSVLGDYIFTVALAFAVLALTGSPSYLGLVFAAQALPIVVIIMVGGVWADRIRRERIMIGADLVRCLSQAALAALLLTHTAQLWQIVALQLVHGAATAVFRPASTGLLPQTVPVEQLQPANALLAMVTGMSMVLGPALGGILAAADPVAGIAIDAATFAVSAAFLARIKVSPGARGPRQSFRTDLAAGWQEVRSRSWMLSSMVGFAAFQFAVLGSLFVLGPVVADRSLGGAATWGVLLAAFGAGGFLGSAAAMRLRLRRPVASIFVFILAVAPALVLLAVAAPVPVIAAGILLAGASIGYGDVVWLSTLQSRVSEQVLSRVAAYDWVGSTVLFPLGLVAAGPIAAVVGVAPTLLGAAAVLVATSAGVLSVPAVRLLTRS
jgi:MFS family permease